MASNVGFATLSIIPSTKGFGRALRGQVAGPLSGAGASGGQALGEGVIGRFRSLVGPALAAAGGVAIGSFVKGAISEAANLEQSIGAIDAVFGENAATMHDWARGAASSVGLTRNQYNELGTIIGSQLRNGGVAMDELGGKTDDLIRLGGDLSAMFGGTTADAVGAVSAALRGERDTIERYGVSLTQAAVDAKAAELGFRKVGGALSQEATQAATIALIMEQTSAAHGAFSRETNTAANRMQVLNATWADSKARLGTAFLPALAGAANALIGVLGPATDAAERGMGRLTEAVGGAWAILSRGEFVGADNFLGLSEDSAAVDVLFRIREGLIGVREILANGNFVGADNFLGLEEDSAVVDVLFRIRDAGLAVTELLSQAPGAVTGILAALGLGGTPGGVAVGGLANGALAALGSSLAALAAALWRQVGLLAGWLPLMRALGASVAPLVATIAAVAVAVTGSLAPALSALAPVVSSLVHAFSLAAENGALLLLDVLGTFAELAGALWGVLGAAQAVLLPLVAALAVSLAPLFLELVSSVAPVAIDALTLVVALVLPLIDVLTGVLIPAVTALAPVLTTVAVALTATVGAAMRVVEGAIRVATAAISGDWGAVWPVLVATLAAVWDGIVALLRGALAALGSLIGAALAMIGRVWEDVWPRVGATFATAWTGLLGALDRAAEGLWAWIRALPGLILDTVGGLGGALLSAGGDLIRGFIVGIGEWLRPLLEAILAPYVGMVGAVMTALGINSPSRAMRAAGEDYGTSVASAYASAPPLPEGASIAERITAAQAPSRDTGSPVERPIYTDSGDFVGVLRQDGDRAQLIWGAESLRHHDARHRAHLARVA